MAIARQRQSRRTSAPADGIPGRDRHALQIPEPLMLFRRATGDEQRGEEFMEGRIVPSPAVADQGDECLALGDLCRTSALEPPVSKSANEHEVRDAVWMAYGIGDRERSAPECPTAGNARARVCRRPSPDHARRHRTTGLQRPNRIDLNLARRSQRRGSLQLGE